MTNVETNVASKPYPGEPTNGVSARRLPVVLSALAIGVVVAGALAAFGWRADTTPSTFIHAGSGRRASFPDLQAEDGKPKSGPDRDPSCEYLTILAGGSERLLRRSPLVPVRLTTSGDTTCGPLMIVHTVCVEDVAEPYGILVYEYSQPGQRHEWKLVATIQAVTNVGHLDCLDVDADGVKELIVFYRGSSDRFIQIYRLLPGKQGWAVRCIFSERDNGNELLAWQGEERETEARWVIEQHFGPPGRTAPPAVPGYERFGDGIVNPWYVRYVWDTKQNRFVLEGSYPERPDRSASLRERWPNPDL